MKWQNLKSKVAALSRVLQQKTVAFRAWLAIPLNLFRFVALLLALDFVAFMALTRSSYLHLLNPLEFLWVPAGDSRQSVELYFPRSLSLTGLEAIYPESDTVAGAARKAGEKILADADVPAEVILIRKKVAAPVAGDEQLRSAAEAAARRVVLELIAGPAGEIESLKARHLLKEPLFLRSIWTYRDKLYVSTEKSVWERMTPNERKVTEYCLLESLKKNIPNTAVALLKE